MTRACLAIDIPRGALLVDRGVAVRIRVRGGLVQVDTADGISLLLEPSDSVLIDEDTPQRREVLTQAAAAGYSRWPW